MLDLRAEACLGAVPRRLSDVAATHRCYYEPTRLGGSAGDGRRTGFWFTQSDSIRTLGDWIPPPASRKFVRGPLDVQIECHRYHTPAHIQGFPTALLPG